MFQRDPVRAAEQFSKSGPLCIPVTDSATRRTSQKPVCGPRHGRLRFGDHSKEVFPPTRYGSSVRKPAQNALVETPQILGFLTSTHGFKNE